MKKKLLSVIAALTAFIACVFSFAACSHGTEDPDKLAPHRDAEGVLTKKGVCVARYNDGNESSAQKVDALSPSWYYTWGVKPNNEYIDAEFVPMIWGGWQMTEENLNYVKENYESGKFTHLLTFNEPDLPDQANLTVDEALAYWKRLEEIGIPLSSPVVSWYDNGHPWLDEFMRKADMRGLRVDFITIHCYQPFYKDGQVEFLKENVLEPLYEKYHRPIWLTEFGAIDVVARDTNAGKLTDGCTEESAQKYIEETTAMLESCGYVERYSWFLDNMNDRGDRRPYEAVYTSLYNDDDTIAPVGETYRGVQSGHPLYLEEIEIFATVGKRYSQQLFAYGGTGDYAFTAKGLPAGLTLSKAGSISGTPTEYGEFEAEITVTDQKLQTRTESFLFTISQ